MLASFIKEEKLQPCISKLKDEELAHFLKGRRKWLINQKDSEELIYQNEKLENWF